MKVGDKVIVDKDALRRHKVPGGSRLWRYGVKTITHINDVGGIWVGDDPDDGDWIPDLFKPAKEHYLQLFKRLYEANKD